MKRTLIVCLLGMGLLLPATKLTANNFLSNPSMVSNAAERNKRIVDCYLEGGVLVVTSDASTGTLIWIKIYNSTKQLVLQDYVSGYSDEVDVSSLSSGNYTATVHTTMGNYSDNFTK